MAKEKLRLKQTHPNLFFAVVVFGVWGILTGINILLTDPLFPHNKEMQHAFGTGYLIFGGLKR